MFRERHSARSRSPEARMLQLLLLPSLCSSVSITSVRAKGFAVPHARDVLIIIINNIPTRTRGPAVGGKRSDRSERQQSAENEDSDAGTSARYHTLNTAGDFWRLP